MRVVLERGDLAFGVKIPQLDRVVSAPTCEDLPIRGEGYLGDELGVALERGDFAFGVEIPQLNRLVVAPTCEDHPIRGEGY